jgi:hypothetical protein
MNVPVRKFREAPQPKYWAMAKIGNGWQRIGAAWATRHGDDSYSVQLNVLPLNFDGRFILVLPSQQPTNESGA